MFEPTRLAASCLEAAYARIVPTPWRRAGGRSEVHGVSGLPSERAQAILPSVREVRHG